MPKNTEPNVGAPVATPHEWAEKLEHAVDGLARDWRYAAADQLHGWSRSAHHFQGEANKLKLTRADYEAALKAAAGFPTVPPHAPALTKLLHAKYKAFKPKKASKKADANADNGAR